MTVGEAIELLEEAQSRGEVDGESISGAVDVLVAETAETYTRESDSYAAVRNDAPTEWDEVMNRQLLSTVRERISAGKLQATKDKKWRLLDVGAGHGRDFLHFAEEPDIEPVALDNSQGFVELLLKAAEENELPPASVVVADMRDLSLFDDGVFQCVRNHATLHHLPVVAKGVGADDAVEETRRVMVEGGVFYVLVKAGDGVQMIDTGEGLGGRFFQLFTEDLLVDLLTRHAFSINHITERIEPRPSGEVRWLFCMAVAS
jgi:ubiquinone/menaquinone biosynthesis C-methylase UbiE